MIRYFVSAMVLTLLVPVSGAWAHESRPALLEIEELQARVYAVTWKVPVRDGATPNIAPRLPDNCEVNSASRIRQFPDAVVSHAIVECEGGDLLGQRVTIEGLETTILETAVTYKGYQSSPLILLLSAKRPSAVISSGSEPVANASAYLALGIQHILLGPDHLLFLLGLLLIITSVRKIAIAITGFTLAHAVTLIVSTLGLVPQPGRIVEVLIALSVLILAVEALNVASGRRSLLSEYPFVVVFLFGLLHGLGFAGALAGIGVPEDQKLLALLRFNIGVEIGQLVFVASCLILLRAVSRIAIRGWFLVPTAASYLIGGIAAYWLITRTFDQFAPVLG